MSFRFRGGKVDETRFKFNDGTSKEALDGLKRNGPYDKESRDFDSFTINYVMTEELRNNDLEGEIADFHRHLTDGLGSYFEGIEDLFDLEIRKNIIEDDSEIESLEENDVLVVFFSDPEKGFEYQKKALNAGVSSQKLNDSFLLSESQDAYSNKLRNIALQIYLKAGGLPWVPADLEVGKPIIGYDTSLKYEEKANVRVTACLFSKEGAFRKVISESRETEVRTRYDTRNDILKEVLSDLEKDIDSSPVVHKGGEINKWEKDIIDDTFAERPVKCSIMTHRPYRLYNKDSRDRRPDRGVYVKMEEDYFALSTTGRPHYTEGTPRALKIRVEDCRNSERVIKDIFRLSGVNYADKKFTSLPFSAHAAKKAEKKLHKDTEIHERLEDKAWFL